MQQSLGKKWGRGQKVVAYSDIVNDDTMISPTIIVYYKYKDDFFNILENDNLFHFYYSLKRENNLLDTISFRASSRLLISPPFSPPKSIAFIPSGAKTQKIKRIDDNKCNVRASKNAEQAFSTQRYLYICYRLFFLFSSVFPK